MPIQETIYIDELNQARHAYQTTNDETEDTEDKQVKVNLIEAAIMIGLFAFLGNDVIDWIWGLLDVGTSGIALVLDWTINNGLNFVTTGIIALWLCFRGLKPGVLQKALIGCVVALVLDCLPGVGFLPIFTIQTTATVLIVNYWEKIVAAAPIGQKAFTIIEGKGKGVAEKAA